jgi:hypothetical protein
MRPSRLRTAALTVALFATAFAASGASDPVVKYPAAASPSAMLIGISPAEPTGDPPGTTPVASDTTKVTKLEESQLKPQEGDHSHSTLATQSPQKADGVNPRTGTTASEAGETKADPAKKSQ